MPSTLSLEPLMSYLNKVYSRADKRNAFLEECKKNAGLEALCIGACEAGELGSESLAYYGLGLQDYNTPGLIGGVAIGLFYSILHTYKHARRHSQNVSVRDAVAPALAAESACILSATGVEYTIGLGLAQPPLTPQSLLFRGIGLLPAFALGLVAMSALTHYYNREATRFLAKSHALSAVHSYASQLPGIGETSVCVRQLTVKGTQSSLIIREQPVPPFLRNIASTDASLYRSLASAVRCDSFAKKVLKETSHALFRDAGFAVTPVENIFHH